MDIIFHTLLWTFPISKHIQLDVATDHNNACRTFYYFWVKQVLACSNWNAKKRFQNTLVYFYPLKKFLLCDSFLTILHRHYFSLGQILVITGRVPQGRWSQHLALEVQNWIFMSIKICLKAGCWEEDFDNISEAKLCWSYHRILS